MAKSQKLAKKKKEKPVFLKEVQIKFKKKRVKNGAPVNEPISHSQQVYELFKDLENETKEKLICISLDIKAKILCFEVVAIGSINSVYARPVEVIRTSIPWNPYGFVIVHNHPSGDPSPSKSDKEFTSKLQKAIETLGCELYDHIIIGDDTYFSFSDAGLL